jgi:hypothetical protein
MDATNTPPTATDVVLVEDDQVTISKLVFTDPLVAEYLSSVPMEQRCAELVRAIGVGVHGLSTTTMRATIDEMQQQVQRIITTATAAAESQLGSALEDGRAHLAANLDPEVRSSLTARAIAELSELHEATLQRFDPERTDSHTARLIGAISDLLGPQGQLAQRLADALDPTSSGNGIGQLADSFERRFQELRDLLIGDQHRREEAQRGTAKGVEFEDGLDELLRTEARSLHGCIVERTGNVGGSLGTHAKVGDFLLTLPDGTRVVVEAKNTARIGLTGSTGILTELDSAMDNRNAQWAICVSRLDAFPGEVGAFAVYGNRVLVVDPGDGVLTGVALRWVAAAIRAVRADDDRVDRGAALERLGRIRDLAQHFSRSKKVLAGAQSSLETVRDELDGLRTQLLDLVDDAVRSLDSSEPEARQVA